MQILIDILDKKITLLGELKEECNEQKNIVTQTPVDWEKFDEMVDAKAAHIEQLSQLDDTFERMFATKKDELQLNSSQHKSIIKTMQDKIRQITDESTELQKMEYQNKALIESAFSTERAKIKEGRRSSKVALDYYRGMSQVNYIDPQLMDQKS